MPPGTALSLNLEAPKGGISAGDVSLTTIDEDLVRNINKVKASNLRITYKFSASLPGGEISGSRAVMFTLTNED